MKIHYMDIAKYRYGGMCNYSSPQKFTITVLLYCNLNLNKTASFVLSNLIFVVVVKT